jgi:hypothetical protein
MGSGVYGYSSVPQAAKARPPRAGEAGASPHRSWSGSSPRNCCTHTDAPGSSCLPPPTYYAATNTCCRAKSNSGSPDPTTRALKTHLADHEDLEEVLIAFLVRHPAPCFPPPGVLRGMSHHRRCPDKSWWDRPSFLRLHWFQIYGAMDLARHRLPFNRVVLFLITLQ